MTRERGGISGVDSKRPKRVRRRVLEWCKVDAESWMMNGECWIMFCNLLKKEMS